MIKIEGPIEGDREQLVIEGEDVQDFWGILREMTEKSAQVEKTKELLLQAGVPDDTLEQMAISLLKELSEYKK